jgi:hypothetical protein
MLLFMCACSNPQKLAEDPARTKIYFGHTGGFTNQEMKYLLVDNGALLKITPDGNGKAGKLSRDALKQIRDKFNTIGFESLVVNEPGNITYFIRIEKPGAVHEVKWSDASARPDLKELYDKLTDTLNP